MDPSRKWPVLLAYLLLTAAGIASVVRVWQWAFMAAAGLILLLTLVVATDLRKFGFGIGKDGVTGTVEWAERAKAELQHAAERAAADLDPTRERRVNESMGGGPAAQEEERQRHAAIENLMAAAARWGWTQAKAGAFTQPPRPVVEWDGERPRILYGTTAAE